MEEGLEVVAFVATELVGGANDIAEHFINFVDYCSLNDTVSTFRISATQQG